MYTLFCLFSVYLEHCADDPEASSDPDLYKPQSSNNSQTGLVEGAAVSVVMLVIAVLCIVVLVIWWRYIGINILGYVNINVAAAQMHMPILRGLKWKTLFAFQKLLNA